MIDKSKIEQLVGDFLVDTPELFLVEVKISTSNDIEIVIDSDTHVSIDQCVALSKGIEGNLDREIEDFSISVYSSGIGQPLTKDRQLAKCVDKDVEVLLKNGLKIGGVLKSFDEKHVSIEYQKKEAVEGKKRKELVVHIDQYDRAEIKNIVELLTIK